jgi:cytochrome c oxidase subunit III
MTKLNPFNVRSEILFALFITIFLGLLFTSIQLYEYCMTPMTLNDGIYTSLFFLLTGFHGLHVLIGTLFLIVCYYRFIKYHFTSDQHIGFEMAI